MTELKTRYKRVLLKLSGEALMGNEKFGIDYQTCQHITRSVYALHKMGIQVGIVIGGGNIFRGVKGVSLGLDRVLSDEIAMLGTIINGKTLQAMLMKEFDCHIHLMSAFSCGQMVERFVWNKAICYLEQNEPVIFVGGTGSPYFTTDSGAALRASEIQADIVLKATKVDGIYDKDPKLHSDAKKFHKLSFTDVLSKNLRVMDPMAIALCRENHIPIRVFNLFEKNATVLAVTDDQFGTLVEGD